MKIKFLTVITSLLAAAFMITSCLDDNEVETEYSSESSITSFAIKDKMWLIDREKGLVYL